MDLLLSDIQGMWYNILYMNNKDHNTKDNNTFGDKEFFLNTLAKYCDKCGTAYNPEDINIVQNTGVSAIIHFSCHNCKSQNLATYIFPIGMSSRSPLNVDLSFEELKKFASQSKVSLEEILEVYAKLKKNSKVSV
jgi:hypothetical protein